MNTRARASPQVEGCPLSQAILLFVFVVNTIANSLHHLSTSRLSDSIDSSVYINTHSTDNCRQAVELCGLMI